MAISIELDPRLEQLLVRAAAACGRTPAEYAAALLAEGLEDIEDARLGEEALERFLASGEKVIPLEELEAALDLEVSDRSDGPA